MRTQPAVEVRAPSLENNFHSPQNRAFPSYNACKCIENIELRICGLNAWNYEPLTGHFMFFFLSLLKLDYGSLSEHVDRSCLSSFSSRVDNGGYRTSGT
jgi:hypothetical protein